MSDLYLAVPKPGTDGAPLRVPFPGRDPIKEPLSPDGEIVELDNYWARRRMHDEVELRETPERAAARVKREAKADAEAAERAAAEATVAADVPADVPAEDSAPTSAPEEPRARRKDAR